MMVWKRNFVLAKCFFVSIKDGKYDEAFAYFRPAGGFTHFYIRKPLGEILNFRSPNEASIFQNYGT